MAYGFVRSSSGSAAAVTSYALPLTAAATAGNTLTVVIGIQSGATVDVSSVTDNAGNTYTQRVDAFQSGSNTRLAIYDCIKLTGAPTTVTITATASTTIRAIVDEHSGIAGFDTALGAGAAASLNPAAPSITTANAGELIIAGINTGGTQTATQSTTGMTTEPPVVATGTLTTARGQNAAAGAFSVPWTLSSSVASGQGIAAYTIAPDQVSFVGAGAPVAGTSGQLNVPMPAGVQAGDVVTVHFTFTSPASGVTSTMTWSWPSDWGSTSFYRFEPASGGSIIEAWYSQVYSASMSAPYITVDTSARGDVSCVAFATAWRGVGARTLVPANGNISADSGPYRTSGGGNPAPFPVTLDDGGMAIIPFANSDGTSVFTAPTGWTMAQQGKTTLGPQGAALGVAYKLYPAGVGYSDTVALTVSNSVAKPSIASQTALWAAQKNGAKVRNFDWGYLAFGATGPVNITIPWNTTPGDLMIISHWADDDATLAALTTPTGWTTIGTGIDAPGGGVLKLHYKIAASGDAGTVVPCAKVANSYTGVTISVFRDWDTTWTPTATYSSGGSPTATTSIDAPSVTGTANGMLATWHLAGGRTGAVRTMTPPAGMIERVDQPALSNNWINMQTNTQWLSAAGATGVKSATATTASGFASAAMAIPAATAITGTLAVTGTGTTSFGPTKITAAGTLAVTGTGSPALAPAALTQSGTLAVSGSGSTSWGGAPRGIGSLAVSGAGTASFSGTPKPAGSFTASGAGTLSMLGSSSGVGTGSMAFSGAGTLSLSGKPSVSGALAVAGAGTLSLAGKPAMNGSLSQSGAGTLSLLGTPHFFGALNISGAGTLQWGQPFITTNLRRWDGQKWVNAWVYRWNGQQWVRTFVYRWNGLQWVPTYVPHSMTPDFGPIYSDAQSNPAATGAITNEGGPTGKHVYRITRTSTGIGSGAYIHADLVGAAIPAGTLVEVSVWYRNSSAPAGKTFKFDIVSDNGSSLVGSGPVLPQSTTWVRTVVKVVAATQWTSGVHRLRAPLQLDSAAGDWLELSDPQIRVLPYDQTGINFPFVRSASQAGGDARPLNCNMPANMQIGDVLYAYAVGDDASSTSITGSTWTTIFNDTTPGRQTRIYRRVVDGTEPASITFQYAGAADVAAAIVCVGNADVSAPEVFGPVVSTGTGSSPAAPAVTPAVTGTLVLSSWSIRDTNGTRVTVTPPADMTEWADTNETWASIAVASKVLYGSGLSGPFSAQIDGGRSLPWLGVSMAIRTPAPPVAYWKLDGDTSDAMGGPAAAGTSTFVSGLAAGSSQAAKFDGTQALTLAPSSVLNVPDGTPFAMECWARVDSFAGEPVLIGSRNSGILVRTDGSVGGYSPNNFYSGTKIGLGEIHHFVLTSDGVNQGVYLDGVLIVTHTNSATSDPGYGFAIGEWIGNGSEKLIGVVDEVALYRRALSATEIQKHYSTGRVS